MRTYSDGDKGGPYYVFHLRKNLKYRGCPKYESCWGKTKRDFRLVINSIHKVDNFSVIKKIEERLLTPEGKEVYSRRMPMIERIFAEIKSNIGYRKFLRKGFQNVQTEWNVICMA
ncbi:MAG: transposase [Spirochaetales bacterium]|nr:transposase [Spirochaetales bacterium]